MRLSIILFFVATMVIPVPVRARLSNDPATLQRAYQQVGASLAWDTTTGRSGVVVAIIDNGFDARHPDLEQNVWKNRDEIPDNKKDDDKNGFVDDVWGWDFAADDNNPNPDVPTTSALETDTVIHHATVVAGIIGAVGNNGQAGAGINWEVELMNLRAVDNSGVGDLDALARAIRYAVENGAHIINVSMVGNGDLRNLRSALDLASDRGVVVIAAAGNNSQSLNEKPEYPACLDRDSEFQKVLGVSAIDANRYFASFSNFGSDCIDITAPGTEIESTMLYLPESGLDTLYAGFWNGTSFAAPFVSGAAALVKSIQPTWKASQIYPALQSTTHRTLGSDAVAYANLFGAGLLQVNKAVQYAKSELSTTPGETSAKNIISVSQLGSRVSTKTLSSQKQKNTIASTLENIRQLVQVEGVEGVAYAALRVGSTDKSEVVLLDQKFQVKKTISLPFTQAMNLVVAKLDYQEEARLIFSPIGSSSTQVVVYSLAGKKIFEKRLPKKHSGTFLALRHDPFLEKNTVFVATKGLKNTLSAQIFSDKGVVIESIPLSLPAKPTGFALIDLVDGEEQELVFSYTQDSVTQVSIFQNNGTPLNSFTLPENFSGGVSMLGVDTDHNGDNELIVAPKKGIGMVRILDVTGAVIDSWYPFGKDFDRGVFLLWN